MDNQTLYIFLGILLVCILIYIIVKSNKLNKYKVIIEESKKNIDIALVKRYDTIKSMLEIAKSYANFEKLTYSELIKHRKGANISDSNKTIKEQDRTIEKIYALAEAYPDLKSSDEFLNLQTQIAKENDILAASKRIVNSNISILNQAIVTFPTSVIAEIKGVKKMDFLEESEVANKKSIDEFDFEI